LRLRLSLLMFLLFAPTGALVPLFSLRLQELGLTPLEIGLACATQAVAYLTGSLLAGQVADRWWPAQRCLAVCGFGAGGLLWLLAGLARPWPVVATTLGFWMFLAPVGPLGTALAFAHLPHPERDFGAVRLWGSVGWVVPGWLLGYWFTNPGWACACVAGVRRGLPRSELADAFRLAALLALALGAYSLTLPHTPPRRRAVAPVATLAALRLLRDRSFAVYVVGSLGVCLTMAFTSQNMPLLLDRLGLPRPWLSPVQTLSQAPEPILLLLLGLLLRRLGLRGTMLLGLAGWAAGLAVFAVGWPLGLVVGMLGTWGLLVVCYLIAGQVFVDRKAHGDVRASAQGLLTAANGIGLLAGSLLAGWVRERAAGDPGPTFVTAAAVSVGLLVLFFAGFRADTPAAREVPSPPRRQPVG
jgi:MFS family permease